MLHEDEAGDAITGLQQKTHYGRPRWSEVFESLATAHPKYVTICFYNQITLYCIAGLFPYVQIFPNGHWSVHSFSRNFPDLEIHDPNNQKTHVSEI